MSWLYRCYLGPEVLAGFDSYKYNSVDTSPLSNYVMHPFWNQVGNKQTKTWGLRKSVTGILTEWHPGRTAGRGLG